MLLIQNLKQFKIEGHVLIVMDETTHEEHLSNALQTNNEQFKTSITLLTCFNGRFIITNKYDKFYFTVSFKHDDFNVISVPLRLTKYSLSTANMNELFSKKDFLQNRKIHLQSNQNYSTLGFILKISSTFTSSQIASIADDSMTVF